MREDKAPSVETKAVINAQQLCLLCELPVPALLWVTLVPSQWCPAELSLLPLQGWAANQESWQLAPGSPQHSQGLLLPVEPAHPSFSRIQNLLEAFSAAPVVEWLGDFSTATAAHPFISLLCKTF